MPEVEKTPKTEDEVERTASNTDINFLMNLHHCETVDELKHELLFIGMKRILSQLARTEEDKKLLHLLEMQWKIASNAA